MTATLGAPTTALTGAAVVPPVRWLEDQGQEFFQVGQSAVIQINTDSHSMFAGRKKKRQNIIFPAKLLL